MSPSTKAMVGLLGFALAQAGSLHAVGLRGAGALAPAAQAATSQGSPANLLPASVPQPRALLDKYCVTCHNTRLKTAGLTLDVMDVGHVDQGAAVWEKVVRKLRGKAMPPPGMPRPDKAAYDSFAGWLETSLDRAAAARPNAGRPPVHRLNRAEYSNAIRDLLALHIDVRSLLPPDESGYGFDNIAGVLSMSQALLERYMLAARKIGRLAVGDPTMGPVLETYRLPRTLVQHDRVSDDLPFRSRGGTVIRHHFTLDGEYVLRIRLQRAQNTPVIQGLANRERLDVRLDGARLELFSVGGECVGSSEPRCVRPAGVNLPASEYERSADAGLELRFQAQAGTRAVAVAFQKRTAAAPEGAAPEWLPAGSSAHAFDQNALMSIESIRIEGPFGVRGAGETPSRRKIFVCRPTARQDEEQCAKHIISTLARRAYRRPVTDHDVRTILAFYRIGRDKGGFEAGIELALERLLVSPEFLIRVEQDPANVAPGATYRLSDLELASRLSFFLWSSIPDDELIDVAARGKLKDPVVLDQQVRRLLADPRATTLVTNFAGQWLHLRNMRIVSPDPDAFPEFDDNLREAFQRETELLFETQLREDRSVVDLLTANYTFVNERLARHYGIPNVYGSHFRRVTLNDDARVGLLGHGSILTVTSYATRTSPVVRGKWLLDTLLGAPPPPPPGNVPPLKETGAGGAPPASMRARMEEHRKNAVCASCHARMDPLGFALENFDGIGKWRTSEASTPIDGTGVLPDGTKFDGPIGLRTALVGHREEFVGAVAEKLLTYALGRGVEHYDMPAIREIKREAAPGGYRWSSLILGIVKSLPFQMRTAQERPADSASSPPDAKRSQQP